MTAETPIERLKNIVKRLRGPGGCPWDIKQTPQSITPHIIEEAYELVDAIESKDDSSIIDELSDQLLHVVMISEMMAEKNAFNFNDVTNHCSKKMIHRHPHIFSNTKADTVSEVEKNWEELKAQEKNNASKSLMDQIPGNLPALMHAEKIQKKAANVGFDWPDINGVKEKLAEECKELIDAKSEKNIKEEIGDILFTITNICRKHGYSAETLLQDANKKFKDRFKKLEIISQQHNTTLKNTSLENLEIFWDQAKKIK